ncbi:cytochrome c family protein [Sphingorhabdus sp. EL138]|uniref:c-type cytochrome n=1 Tax=Sphingorhabdus sp. EL138 TaxID=2073156 RepID=UPI0025D42508|nr:cytochrome c family protein [Sphingorhabdus sp. EL138]
MTKVTTKLRMQGIGYVANKDTMGEFMVNTKARAGLVALSVMLAACSGGSEGETDTSVQPDASAPAAPAGPLAATDVSTLDGTSFANFTGNAANGKMVFAACRTCHVTDAGVNKIGPSLHNIIGRTAGTVPGFTYSAANAGAGFVWTKEKLFQFLEKPQRVIPQTKMIYAGLPDAQKRADLIAYLETPN